MVQKLAPPAKRERGRERVLCEYRRGVSSSANQDNSRHSDLEGSSNIISLSSGRGKRRVLRLLEIAYIRNNWKWRSFALQWEEDVHGAKWSPFIFVWNFINKWISKSFWTQADFHKEQRFVRSSLGFALLSLC